VDYRELTAEDVTAQLRLIARQAELAHLQLSVDQEVALQTLAAETDPERRRAVQAEIDEREKVLATVERRIGLLRTRIDAAAAPPLTAPRGISAHGT
jgi:hypothetical protein